MSDLLTIWVRRLLWSLLFVAAAASAQVENPQAGIPVRVWGQATSGGSYNHSISYQEIGALYFAPHPGGGWVQTSTLIEGGVAKKIYRRNITSTYVTALMELNGAFLPWKISGDPGQPSAVSMEDGSAQKSATATAPNQQMQTDLGMVRIVPGKLYTISATQVNLGGATLNVVPPPGYKVVLNGMVRNGAPLTASTTFRVLPIAGGHPGIAGSASTVATLKVDWRLALGTLRNGDDAGFVELVDTGASNDWSPLFTPAGLSYAATSDEVFVQHKNGTVRQIIGNQIAVDIVTLNSTAYELRCYSTAQITSYAPCSFSGVPFVTYTIKKSDDAADAGSSSALKFIRETRNVTDPDSKNVPVSRREIMKLKRSVAPSGAITWTKTDWTVEGEAVVAETTVESTGGVNSNGTYTNRAESVKVKGSAGTALTLTRGYSLLACGEMLTSEQLGSANPRSASFSYYSDITQPGNFGFVQAITTADGGWEAYDYYDTTLATGYQIGQVKHKFRPFVNVPANSTRDPSAGEVTSYEYEADPFGFRKRLKASRTYVNGVMTAQTLITYQPYGGSVRQFRKDYTSATGFLTTTTVFQPENAADAFVRGKPLSIEHPDGRTQTFTYQRGGWNGTTFTPNEAPSAASRIIIDNGPLVAGKTTREVTIRDERALVVRTELHVWNNNAWNLVSYVNLSYNFVGLLVSRTASNGATYTAIYDGLLKTSETDEAGNVVGYLYNSAGRVSVTTKGGADSIPSLSTRFLYDATGNVLREEMGAGLPEQLVSTRQFDDGGRLIAETKPGEGTTSFSYDVPNRTRTGLRPDGGTVIEAMNRDGRPASRTGSGVVAQFTTYGIDANGYRWTQVNTGAADSPRWQYATKDWRGRAVADAKPKPGSTTAVFYGNLASDAIFLQQSIYNDVAGSVGTGRMVKSTESDKAGMFYNYDSLGQISRSGLDVSGNNALDLVSTDRITDHEETFEFTSNAWWARKETKTYLSATSGTPTTMTRVRTRLSGFPSGRLEEVQTTDSAGNTTVRTKDVDRAVGKVVLTMTTTGIANAEVETVIAGLVVSKKSTAGLTTATSYDALLRVSEITDPRGIKTRTTYIPGTALVHTVTQPYIAPGHASNITVATYSYDSSRRRISETNAAGYTTFSSYTFRNQLLRTWGTAAIPVEFGYDPIYGEKVTMKTFRAGTGWGENAWPGTPGNTSNSPGAGDTTTWAYDPATGVLLSKTDADNKSVAYTYNRRGQLLTRTWARGVVTTYAYDAATAEQKDIAYSDGTPALHYGYNRLGQESSIEDVTGVRALEHCLCGKVESELLSAGFYGSRRITYKLSQSAGSMLGRTMGYSLSQGSTLEQDVAYNYDPASGRLRDLRTQTLFSAGTHEFHYAYLVNTDIIQSLSVDSGHPFTISRQFESARDVLTSIDAMWSTTSRARFDYTVNALGQRSSIKQSGNVFADYGDTTLQSLQYNSKGEITAATGYLGYGVDSSKILPDRQHAYAYDNIGNRQWSNVTGNATLRDDYQANALNQYTTKENNVLTVSGSADLGAKVVVAGRTVAAARKGGFWSDQVTVANVLRPWRGPLTIYAGKAGAGLSGVDLLRTDVRMGQLPQQSQTFSYDLDGNLTSDGVWNYVWDAENRLIRMTTTPGAVAGGYPNQRLEFKYDYLGRRVQKQVFDNGSNLLQSSRRFVYQGWNLIAEYAVSGSALTLGRSYTWGLDIAHTLEKSGGVGALVQIADHALGKAYFPAYDGNGNIAALFDGGASGGTAGSCVAAYEYSPFGEFLRCEGTYAKGNPFRFSTKFTDDETGLVYYGRRYYSQSQGRFLGRDPKGEKGGLNIYAFTANDPINRYDYMGMTVRWTYNPRTGKYTVSDNRVYDDQEASGSSEDGDDDFYENEGDDYSNENSGADPMVDTCRGMQQAMTALTQQYTNTAKRLSAREAVYEKMMAADVSVSGMINWGEEAWEAFFPIASLGATTPALELTVGMADGTLNMAKSGVDQEAIGFAKSLLTTIVAIGSYTGQLSAEIASKMSPWVTGAELAAFAARVTVPLQVSVNATLDQNTLWRRELQAFKDSAANDLAGTVRALEETAKIFDKNDCPEILKGL